MHRTTFAVAIAGTFALAMASSSAAAGQQTTPAETCDILVSQDGVEQELTLPNYSVIEKTADPNFTVVPGPEAKLLAFVCDRADIVPAENDWKILAAGYKLHIRARGLEGILEMSGGSVRYHLTDRHDRMGSEATSRLDPLLVVFQQKIDAAPKPAPAPAAPAAPAAPTPDAVPPPPDAQPAPPPPGQ
jgi:hypothetical protein